MDRRSFFRVLGGAPVAACLSQVKPALPGGFARPAVPQLAPRPCFARHGLFDPTQAIAKQYLTSS